MQEQKLHVEPQSKLKLVNEENLQEQESVQNLRQTFLASIRTADTVVGERFRAFVTDQDTVTATKAPWLMCTPAQWHPGILTPALRAPVSTGYAKDALNLAQMQELTLQL
ncbi:ATPase family AAA domain-containing protein 3C-like isoform X1 [Rhinopithecus roxellana]|uniref:ATPase family AAA domain-containing protein 3C-like isoform X1 n=1 Tax=Rhinopithecus roxellana TaxID=61622 RepID=UPI0012378F0B|nr:ATPase family AAA domain-containing protein 3C-like isoform X1 [Rhinopithecus roxellana]